MQRRNIHIPGYTPYLERVEGEPEPEEGKTANPHGLTNAEIQICEQYYLEDEDFWGKFARHPTKEEKENAKQ